MAEQSVQSLRDIGTALLAQVKEGTNLELKVNWDLTAWAHLHAAMLHNCYAVQGGTTAYEHAFHTRYQGKLAQFGECVYFVLASPHVKKGRPKFARGIFVGKSLHNDATHRWGTISQRGYGSSCARQSALESVLLGHGVLLANLAASWRLRASSAPFLCMCLTNLLNSTFFDPVAPMPRDLHADLRDGAEDSDVRA